MRYLKYLIQSTGSKSAGTIIKLWQCKLARYPIYLVGIGIILVILWFICSLMLNMVGTATSSLSESIKYMGSSQNTNSMTTASSIANIVGLIPIIYVALIVILMLLKIINTRDID